MGGRNVVRVRNIVVAAIFDFMIVSTSSPGLFPTHFLREKPWRRGCDSVSLGTRPISSSLREVSTWRFRKQIARSKKTPALQAICRLANSQATRVMSWDALLLVCIPTILCAFFILGDPWAVSRVGKKGGTKVLK